MRGTTFSITLPDPSVKQVRELADKLGVSRSGAVKFIIQDYFKTQDLIQLQKMKDE